MDDRPMTAKPKSDLRLDPAQLTRTARRNSPKSHAMIAQSNRDFDQIDHKTCRSICDAVGERLQQSMRPEPGLTSHLQQLMDELRRRERDHA